MEDFYTEVIGKGTHHCGLRSYKEAIFISYYQLVWYKAATYWCM